MKKRKKILIVILIFLVFVTIGITVLKVLSLEEDTSTPSLSEEIDITPTLTKFRLVSPCVNKLDCPSVINAIYAEIESGYEDVGMQKWIQKTNQETEQYFQETINSSVADASCSQEAKDYYQYSMMTETEYNIYSGERYISLSVKRVRKNLCTDEFEYMPVDVYLYDIEAEKEITQEELKSNLLITDDFVQQIISQNIETINQSNTKNLTLEDTYKDGILDYTLYYSSSGYLMVSYYQNSEQVYYSTVVLEN